MENENENGDSPQLIAIVVGFNPETQTVALNFDTDKFKTWDFVCAVLNAGLEEAKFRLNLIRMQNMQAAQHQQALSNQIRASLRHGHS